MFALELGKTTMSRMGNHGTYYENGITIIGNHNVVNGDGCTVMGNHNIVRGSRCNVMGNHNCVSSTCTVTGNFNTYLDGGSAGSYAVGVPAVNKRTGNIVVNSAIGSANGAGNIVIDGANVFDSAIGFVPGSRNPPFVSYGSIDSVGSMPSFSGTATFNGNCTIGRQDFSLTGGRTLTLLNIRAESHILRNGTTTIKLHNGHELEYKDQSMTYDGKPVPLDFLFSMHNVTNSLTLEFSEFLDFLEDLPSQEPARLDGADEETEDESRACVVCLDNVKCCAIMPCAHMCVCIACGKKVTQSCPICRGAVKSVKRIFG